MPYRKLPQSDTQRYQALSTLALKLTTTAPEDPLPISADTRTRFEAQFPGFKKDYLERDTALGNQKQASLVVDQRKARLHMVLSHFLQTLYNGSQRGEIPAGALASYGLSDTGKQPPLGRSAQLREAAERAINAEQTRLAAGGLGGAIVTFPHIDDVSDALGDYDEAKAIQSDAKDDADKEGDDVAALRDTIDDLILDIWDEVEFAFRKESPSSIRDKAREWGVLYVNDRGEVEGETETLPEEPSE